MRQILMLPPDVVDKIAAGEMVERPASIAKELIENGLDAGATSLRIEVVQGGRDRIVVSDDGSGMSREDLKLSVLPHTTSKIRAADDLWNISTFGFRGEALASIGAVSKLRIETKLSTQEVLEGSALLFEGGKLLEIVPMGCPTGTSISVSSLFYNTPARQKFLKSETVEYGHIAHVVENFALSHPHVRFELWNHHKKHLSFPQEENSGDRIASVLGGKLASHLVSLHEQGDGISLQGWISKVQHDAGSAKQIHFFVNARSIADRLLHHALMSGYGDLLMKGRYPKAVLFLTIDPAKVDVNVHPTKREVRFEESHAIYEFVRLSIRKHLDGDRNGVTHQRSHFKTDGIWVAPRPDPRGAPPTVFGWGGGTAEVTGPTTANRFEMTPAAIQYSFHSEPKIKELRVIGQFLKTYILCEDESGSLVVVDQHAVHERIGFEELKREYAQGKMSVQSLLLPEQLHLSTREIAVIENYREILEKSGFEFECFGHDTLMVKATPALIADIDLKTLFEKIAAELEEKGKLESIEKILEELFALIACHRQIRGGDKLSILEMEALLKEMQRLKITHCPHGRPLLIRVEKNEIERRLKRI